MAEAEVRLNAGNAQTPDSDGKSTSSRKKPTKKKDDYSVLADRMSKQEEKFASLDTKLDRFFSMLMSENKENAPNEAFGAARGQHTVSLDSAQTLFGKSAESDRLPGVPGPVVSPRADRDRFDELSFCVGSEEKRNCGFLSSHTVQSDLSSEVPLEPVDRDRFVRCLTENSQPAELEVEPSALQKQFGSDAMTSKGKTTSGLCVDNSQREILNASWHSDHPERLASYRDVNRNIFPVHEDSQDLFKVPGLDDSISTLLENKHGRGAAFGRQPSLYSKSMKTFERLSYNGQLAARMGLISTCYMQQALGVLLNTLQSSELNVDRAVQMVRDIFAMSSKTLDQVARTGAYHHLVRRQATLIDTGLCEYKEYVNTVMSLPLTSDGVFGAQFDKRLKEKSELWKNLAEVLPECLRKPSQLTTSYKRKAPATSSGPNKRLREDFKPKQTPQQYGGYRQNFQKPRAPTASKMVSNFRRSNADKKF